VLGVFDNYCVILDLGFGKAKYRSVLFSMIAASQNDLEWRNVKYLRVFFYVEIILGTNWFK
jgi:hypothetical protein